MPAAAVEDPQREIVQVLLDRGFTPADDDLGQLSKAIAFGFSGNADIPVLGWQASPPASPNVGDRYVVAPSPTGAWAGQAQKVAIWVGQWTFVSAIPGLLANYLNAGDISLIWFNGSAWQPLVLRRLLREDLTVWVRPDGNDNNDGGANSAARAFATIQGAWNYIAGRFDAGGQTITIALGAPGIYDGFRALPYSGRVNIQGDVGPSDNYVIRCRNANAISEVVTSAISELNVTNCVLSYTYTGATAAGAEWIVGARGGGQINVIGCRYRMNANRTGLIINSVDSKCVIAVRGATQIQGSYLCSHFVQVLGAGVFLGGVVGQVATINLAAGQTYNNYFCQCSLGGVSEWSSCSFTGSTSPTAIRYLVSLNGVISTSGGGANYLPGSVAGVVQTGGQYA
ncbi:DUF2793 domain-containing protein [Aureimonas altamirensis]|uniref:DUF2793 domain-containing protein n=1 Tax=Aureimonas altamirensis TaxID=370622 RepID=UPI001E5804C1|nr:DUF2793 domain-containing protein [Aureimonas altamirensis]UHD45346.1 DUF2793 domain-containing protein [Aureimonas altamirensis]